MSLGYLVIGLTFGFNLWRADRPFAMAFWFAVVFFPVLLIIAIRSTSNVRRFWSLWLLSWIFVAFWAFYQLMWMPWTNGGKWGW